MAVIGDLVARLTADTSKFDRNLDASRGTLSSFSGFAKTAVAGLAGAVAGISLWQLGKGAISAAADFETAAVSMEVLTGSAETGRQVMADLAKFAAETPFEMPELNSATTKLLAFGVSADELIPTLKAVGDISSGIQAPIAEIAEIYGKARVQGRLFMEDINQLTGRGIPIIQELAKQFGVSESKVRELVSSGKVNFGNLETAFQDLTAEGGKFGGMMDRQSQTLSGKWATFQDTLSALSREFGNVLLPAAKSVLDAMIPWLETAAENVKAFGDDAAFAFRNFADLAQLSLIELQLAIFELLPGSEGVFQELGGLMVATWEAAGASYDLYLQRVKGGFEEIGQVASAVFDALAAAWDALKSGGPQAAADAFVDTFIETFANQQNVADAGDPFAAFAKSFQETRDAVKQGFAESGGLGADLRAERQRLLDAIANRESAFGKSSDPAAGGETESAAAAAMGGVLPKLGAALEKGSAEALSAINRAGAGRREPIQQVAELNKQQLAEQKKIAAELARQTRAGRPIVFSV